MIDTGKNEFFIGPFSITKQMYQYLAKIAKDRDSIK